LNVSESVNEVDLKRYITDLSELVKDSYNIKEKNVSLFITCDIEILSITKALPLGLIIVELVSNSMKHAFKNQTKGIINIEITQEKNSKRIVCTTSTMALALILRMYKPKGLG
jgi:two-component sensor histidine kinase